LIYFFDFIIHKFVYRILRRSNYGSLPNIHENFLSEDLDFNFNNITKSKYKTTDIIRERYFIDEEKKVNYSYIYTGCVKILFQGGSAVVSNSMSNEFYTK
jgi:hypothetical protein